MSSRIERMRGPLIKKCPVCEKQFDISWMPDYVYKREHKFYCSWTCFRKDDPDKKHYIQLGGRNK